MTPAERAHQVDDWISTWRLRLDETERWIHSDGRRLTTYQQHTIDQNQVAIRTRLLETLRAAQAANRAHLRRKALENTARLITSPKDTLAQRTQPAVERMQQANLWVLKTGRNVKRLEWVSGVGIVDDRANHHPHPIGCLPEVLWWIDRMFPADTALLHWGHNEAKQQSGGGVA